MINKVEIDDMLGETLTEVTVDYDNDIIVFKTSGMKTVSKEYWINVHWTGKNEAVENWRLTGPFFDRKHAVIAANSTNVEYAARKDNYIHTIHHFIDGGNPNNPGSTLFEACRVDNLLLPDGET